jgi:hypothetical protein
MFRITRDPLSGSDNLYLTGITYNGSNVLVMCVIMMDGGNLKLNEISLVINK